MSTDGYELLAHRIRAAYPSAYISDLTIADWTHRLSELEPGPAREVAERLSNLGGPPDPWDFRNARRAVTTTYFKALPAGDPPKMTPEQQANYDRVKALLREKPVGRVYPKALDSIPDEDLFPKFRLRRGMLCSGAGQYAVLIDGKPCCPDCKEPLPSSSAGREGN